MPITIQAELIPPDQVRPDLPDGIRMIMLTDAAYKLRTQVHKAAQRELNKLHRSEYLEEMISVSNQITHLAESYDQAARAIGDRIGEYFLRAQALEKEGQVIEAIECYEKILALHHYPYLHAERLRILYTKLGRYEDALRVCRSYLKTLSLLKKVWPKHPNLQQKEKWQAWVEKLTKKLQANHA